MVHEYLEKISLEYRTCAELRQKGWDNPAGDEFFRQQRQNADTATSETKTAKFFYQMMKHIAQGLHTATGALDIMASSDTSATILDFCLAPGGFLETAMKKNTRSRATAFSLSPAQGGHEILMPPNSKVKIKLMDITMLAADMGVTGIPEDHPDLVNFLPRELPPGEMFDLVFCDGMVLRTHARADYREGREATRLTLTQLALGLEHLEPGGTMVVLLHKVDIWETVRLLSIFDRFASIKLYKHSRYHAKRSSFYMVATKVDSRSERAASVITGWKRVWRVATFGSDEEYKEAMSVSDGEVETVLANFRARLAELGSPIWEIQSKALEQASFVKGR